MAGLLDQASSEAHGNHRQVRIDALTGLPGTAEQYWKWGVPSVILGLATGLIWAYSHFVVQPRILSHYEDKADQFFVDLGISDKANETLVQVDSNQNKNSDASISFASRRKKFDGAKLAIRRLMLMDSSNLEYRYEMGRLCSEYGDWLQQYDFEAGTNDSDTGTESNGNQNHQMALASARAEWKRASDSMRQVFNQQQTRHREAALWLLRRSIENGKLGDNPVLAEGDSPPTEFSRWLTCISQIGRDSPEWKESTELLAETYTRQALDFSTDHTSVARKQIAMRAVEKAQSLENGSSKVLAWQAEAEYLLENRDPFETARRAIIQYWDEPSSEYRVDRTVRLFRLMCLLGDWEVAQSELERALKSMPVDVRREVQIGIAEACVRMMLVKLNIDRPDAPSAPNVADLMTTSLKSNADGPARELVLEISNVVPATKNNANVSKLNDRLESLQTEPVLALRDSIVFLEGATDEFESSMIRLAGCDTEWINATGAVIYYAASRKQLSQFQANRWFDSLCDLSPSTVGLKYASALLYEQQGDFEKSKTLLSSVLTLAPEYRPAIELMKSINSNRVD